jgi:two-component system alkaline phosphatase synthesis response regulator PhoP
MKKILLVEDEPGLILTLTDRLKNEGYNVDTAEDGIEGEKKALNEEYDLIVLDIMLPGKDGFEICKSIRKEEISTPVLMLTARGQLEDKVSGLQLGADDYLTKPFETIELLARIEALLRRSSMTESSREEVVEYSFGDVNANFRTAEIRKNGNLVELSAREFQLLKYFIENNGAVLSREELLNQVWGYQAMPSTRTVDVHVAWLRQKIENNPREPKFIITVHGLGYKFIG